MHRDVDSPVHRLRAHILLSWEKEARTLAWFGLDDGMSVMELGSGPGFFTEQLFDLLPSSSITAVEIDLVLVERAGQYLQGKASIHDRSFVQASVMDTGLTDNSFVFMLAHMPV